MATKKQSSPDVEEIVTVSSNIEGGACHICRGGFGDNDFHPHFERQLNHYLAHPGTRILHVGQETHRDMDGNPYQTTVAVVAIPRTSTPSNYFTKKPK